ncbi:MAG: hypothetical protein QOG15_3682 [Solirubrobacteraceae bacterium]|nr:hypothetical protein [Solirubrobacteraceae bacterium]
MSERALRALVATSFVAGLVLMIGFDRPLTRVLGVLSLLGFVVAGLFAIADPRFLGAPVALATARRTSGDMDYDAIITLVQEAADADRERAERAAHATLETLAERISGGEARQLADQLPPELSPWLNTAKRSEPFTVDEFVRRVAAREAADRSTAERDVRIVFAALSQSVSPREFDDIVSELDKSYAPLLPRGPYVEVMPAGEILRRVAQRTGLDEAGALRATEAVLETLGERIAGGEVDDLIARLPLALHDPLYAGRARSDGLAHHVSLDEFALRVAEREGTSDHVLAAREHVVAVLAALREALGDEFWDVTVQLPGDLIHELHR